MLREHALLTSFVQSLLGVFLQTAVSADNVNPRGVNDFAAAIAISANQPICLQVFQQPSYEDDYPAFFDDPLYGAFFLTPSQHASVSECGQRHGKEAARYFSEIRSSNSLSASLPLPSVIALRKVIGGSG